ncbi:xylosyltransferase oxt-like isoform X2 [Dreissena polymorpha]|uniref:xylosyltransferase oxt-like isoform X2 n=1 Tax=Dreissena polymorpha TaxID=45954 RepID=UPI002263C08E|nr:xylosyltransferase oxt-like isoform X2 [Dreissena polymorpha]
MGSGWMNSDIYCQVFIELSQNICSNDILGSLEQVSVLDNVHKSENKDSLSHMDLINSTRKMCTNITSADVSKEAVSVLRRASTDQCKNNIMKVACLNQASQLYPMKLPNKCPLKGNYTGGQYLGCFRDNQQDRDLANHNTKFPKDNSPQICVEYCITGGYQYAGVQYKNECWCGNKFGKHGSLSETLCSSECPGNKTETCGGYNAQRVFATGLPARSFMPAMLVHNASEVQGQQDVRVVFVLTVNGRAVRQVHRLINTLYHPRHYFYIHVDSRSEYMYRELLPLESQLANVRLTRERFATIWGGASLLQAHLSFMRSLLEMTDWYWDYYINLSESDYPLKPMQQLTWFLNKYKGYNFLKSNGRETHEFMKKQGLEYLFYECDNHLWRIGTSPIPLGIRVDGGSDWLGLYRDFIRYAVYGQDPLVLGLEEFYKYSLLPVESFFHTLLANSEFCSWVVDNNLHATNWKRKQGCKCQHKNQVDWCGCSPNVFKSEDLNKLLGYKGKATFFGRKFEPVINQDIINTLDSLNGRDISEEPGLIHYWENDYHYQDKLNDRTDTWRSFMESMVHRTQSIMAHAQESCSLFNINIIESHILNVADSFYRYLIKFNATLPSRPDPVTLESQYNYKSTYKILNPDGPIGRLITLEVGSDYDLKELIFRNYARFLGPNSDVRLRLVWRYGGVFNMAVAWIDPSGVVASYENVTVGKESLIDVHNPNLKRPLRPGVWTVNLIYSEKICAELKFLVVPYSRYKGQEITTVLASQLHNGPSGSYSPRNASNPVYKYHIDNAIELHEKSVINGRKMGEDLRMWIDELTAQFWSVEDACTVVNVEPVCSQLELCHETTWSSLSPDPKTQISLKYMNKSKIN